MPLGCFLAVCVISQVNAFVGPPVDPHMIYQVAPGSAEKQGDLEWQEFNGELRNALIISGFNVPPTPETEPQVMVLLQYANKPNTRTLTTTSSGSPGATTIAPTIDGMPQLGYTATTTGAEAPSVRTQQVQTNIRQIEVIAFDFKAFKESKQLKQVWKVQVTSEGTGDLRSVLPVLLAEARPYFGKSTGGVVEARMRPQDPEAQAVRTGVPVGKSK